MKRFAAITSALEKLESRLSSGTTFPYVIRVSNPPTEQENAQMRANEEAGQPFVIVPHKASSWEEWYARYGDQARV